MKQRLSTLTIIASLVLLATTQTFSQDLRDKMGTRSMTAAKTLEEAIQLVEKKETQKALPMLQKVLAEDADCQLAYLWKAIAHTNLGDLDTAFAAYDQLVKVAERTRITDVAVDGCIDCGLLYAKAEQEDQAVIWFTKSVMLDPRDQYGLRWKAYRNMAIALKKKGRHLSAALCTIEAYQSNPQRVGRRMVEDFLKQAEGDEAAQILYFPDEPRRESADAGQTQLSEVQVAGLVNTACSQLLLDEKNRRVIVTNTNSSKYLIVDYANNNAVKEIEAPAGIRAVTLVGGEFYVSLQSPAAICQVDVASGREIRRWQLDVASPTSLAVVPANRVAIFPVGETVHVLDLDSGKLKKTEFPSTAVASDPTQRFCYGYLRPESRQRTGTIIVDGRPIFIQTGGQDWSQTDLFKFAVGGKDLLIASFRMNSASNGRQLCISPDGRLVGVVGGGGWRPETKSPGAGYSIAIFDAANFSKLSGAYATSAYPLAAAINPVSGQVAAVREQDASIYREGKTSDPVKITGPFKPTAIWSGDGRYLYIADKKSGIRVWENKLSTEEQRLAERWMQDLARAVPRAAVAVESAPSVKVEPIAEFKSFSVKNKIEDVRAAIQAAEKKGSALKPLEWLTHAPYRLDAAAMSLFTTVATSNSDADSGIHIHRLVKIQKDNPQHPGVHFLLGISYFRTNQLDPAKTHLLAAIAADQGRTNITVESLRCLGNIFAKQNDSLAAAFCYANVLSVDKSNSRWLGEAEKFFEQAGVSKEASALLTKAKAESAGADRGGSGDSALPALGVSTDDKRYPADQLFAKAAPSVVMIRAARSSGSGVCVGRNDIILTNYHVVRDTNRIEVFPYKHDGKKLVRMRSVAARVLKTYPNEDLAILQLDAPVDSLVPLPVATTPPRAGERVYAIGSPGMGDTVLEQSITEGIISSPTRVLERQTYIQHTAAVNPGNSGGPLFDERCQVIGIVTLKAGLENVSFAVPAATVRKFFPKE